MTAVTYLVAIFTPILTHLINGKFTQKMLWHYAGTIVDVFVDKATAHHTIIS